MRRRAVMTWMLCAALPSAGCSPEVKQFLLGPSAVPTPAPSAAPSPLALATPQPAPAAPTPTPERSPEEGGADIPDNDATVVKVGAKVFFVECEGQHIPGTEYAATAPVGCRLHMDCTPKDAANQHTRAKGTPWWTISDPSIVSGGDRSSYNPTFVIKATGELELYVELDGVRSNTVRVRFVESDRR